GTNEMVGMNVSGLMPADHAKQHDGYIRSYMRSGRARIIGVGRQLTACRKDGSTFPIELTVNEIKLEGRRLFVGLLRDITKVKADEEQRSRLTKELTDRIDELKRLNDENAMLSRLGSYLQACATRAEVYDVLLAHIRALFPRESGALYMLSDFDHAKCVLSWGREKDLLSRPIEKQECWAMRRGVTHDTSDNRASLRCRHHNGVGAGEQLCVPVMTQNGPIGLLSVHVPADGDDGETIHAEYSRTLLTGIADRLGPALSSIELRARLQEDSIRDPLTKLYNRRFMEETLRREMRRVRRTNSPLSLIMLDLDRFKQINDEHGHEVGDDVLVAVGQQLKNSVREEDSVCRIGGEEFVIVMPGASLEAARARAQEVTHEIRALRVRTSKGELKITISAGVATFPEHGETQEELIAQADKALYLAKRSGRDRIELAVVAKAS
ncbi:MAG TPA: diguanylate cyclase, partial [Pseudomonadales bacterium]